MPPQLFACGNEHHEALESSEEDDVVADSAPAAIAAAPLQSTRNHSTADSKMKELASELAKAGDDLVHKYGPEVHVCKTLEL